MISPQLALSAMAAAGFLCVRLIARHTRSYPQALAVLVLAAGSWTTLITEIWSVLGGSWPWVATISWGVFPVIVALATAALRSRGPADPPSDPPGRSAGGPLVAPTGAVLPAALALCVLWTGWVCAPNNYDALTYRLPRVFQWMQNGSLEIFATSNIRQVLNNPWTDYALLHLAGLTGTDRLFFLPQFIAWGVSIVLAAAIAGELAGESSRGAKRLAAVYVATLPIAVLQASSVQTDLVASMWMCCLAYCVLLYARTHSRVWSALSGVALGLAVLTKATTYFFALPIALWYLRTAARRGKNQVWRDLVPALVVAMALNAGFFARNLALTGSVLGSVASGAKGEDRYLPESADPRLALSTLARNLALHLQVPVRGWDERVGAWVRQIHHRAGIDPDDPRTTIHTRFFVSRQNRFEDVAGNPVHLALLLAGLALCAVFRRFRAGALGSYMAVTLCGMIIFSLGFKWQIWNSRFHLTFFALCAPWVAVVLAGALPMRVTRWIGAGLLCISFYWALNNETRPLLGPHSVLGLERSDTLYNADRHLKPQFEEMIGLLRRSGVRRLGLAFHVNDWEYPLWKDLPGVRIDHVYVDNATAAFAARRRPEAVIFSKNFINARRAAAQDLLKQWKLVLLPDFALGFSDDQ